MNFEYVLFLNKQCIYAAQYFVVCIEKEITTHRTKNLCHFIYGPAVISKNSVSYKINGKVHRLYYPYHVVNRLIEDRFILEMNCDDGEKSLEICVISGTIETYAVQIDHQVNIVRWYGDASYTVGKIRTCPPGLHPAGPRDEPILSKLRKAHQAYSHLFEYYADKK
jgi:hypothetical protein